MYEMAETGDFMTCKKNEKRWTASDIPSQKGRSIVITGTGGLAFEDALALARAGGDIILAGRNPEKGAAALEKIRIAVPSASIRFEQVDLADLFSIEAFGARIRAQQPSLDTLINNAAVMAPPKRQATSNGFELQFGTNYLGHFALTAQLLPLLKNGKNPRVINVCSIADRQGVINFSDLQSEKTYVPMVAYSQSKLANLIFSLELQRRSEAQSWGINSIAAHPGISRTDLLHNGSGKFSLPGLARSWLWFIFQPAAQGALPTLFAATSPNALGGAYYGPDKMGGIRGFPAPAPITAAAKDPKIAKQLWEVSEKMTNLTF